MRIRKQKKNNCWALCYKNSSRVVDQACGQLRFWGQAGANEELARIAAVADGTHGSGDKPKGMHWKTFERLVAEEQHANHAASHSILIRYGMII